MPERIQRRRTKGWLMPEGAIYVGRPTIFGNPFPVHIYGRDESLARFKRWVDGQMTAIELAGLSFFDEHDATDTLRKLVDGMPRLRGHDLACWCPLNQACHADVLLELANKREKGKA